MRRFLPRVVIACVAFLAGTLAGAVHQHLVAKRPTLNVDQAATIAAPPQVTPPLDTDENYPEDLDIGPRQIQHFIEQHPRANLTRLWERLGLRDEKSGAAEWSCNHCQVQSFDYNLDDDIHEEVVLRIVDEMRESSTYLIFKLRAYDDSTLLGHFTAWGKYRPSNHAVLFSGGKAWLVVESQGATGSGLAVYVHTIYQVSSRAVKPVLSYYNEIHQSGYELRPSKFIVGRPVSIEVRNGKVRGTVSYTVQYSGYDIPSLFKKQQTAVLVGSYKSERLDTKASDITPHEFETVFNFDSMFEEEFLKYNRSELRAIATGRDRIKKDWLKEYLATCENNSIKRELLSLLR